MEIQKKIMGGQVNTPCLRFSFIWAKEVQILEAGSHSGTEVGMIPRREARGHFRMVDQSPGEERKQVLVHGAGHKQ